MHSYKNVFGEEIQYVWILHDCLTPDICFSFFFNIVLQSTQQRRSCCVSRLLANHRWHPNRTGSHVQKG